uniref:Uncharacterized protein n=1 Tax=Pseudictyota dubia TaxID=2749911 RepID=A0A7R9YZA4_9STRA
MLPTIASKANAALVARSLVGSLGGGIRSLVNDSSQEQQQIDPDSPRPPNAQDFVKVRIEPGEWDDGRTDPTYRPPWKKNRARIVSAEDYANRPKAGFSNQFASPHDAMLLMCWLGKEDREAIYQLYLDMMESMAKSDRGVTSHEYVMRVVAQKFGISTKRAAAVVQLQHNEDRIRKEKPEQKIYYEVQEHVDAMAQNYIKDLYEFYGEDPPKGFVEDPMGTDGTGDPDRLVRGSTSANDLYDVDALMRQKLIREKAEAQLSIDGHVYVEDVDDAERDVKLDGNAKKLMEAAKNAVWEDDSSDAALATDGAENGEASAKNKKCPRRDDQAPLPNNGLGIAGVWAGKDVDGRRPRWKFAAKIIDTTKDAKKIKRNRKLKKTYDKGVDNTLIEHDGTVRPATVKEAYCVSWKPVRNEKEFMFKDVKQAWLDRTLRGKTDAWGRVERDIEKENVAEEQAKGGEEMEGEEDVTQEMEGEDRKTGGSENEGGEENSEK